MPIYYFPTTTIFVDDSLDFLTNFSLQLSQSIATISFDNAADALTHIRENTVDICPYRTALETAADVGGNPMTHQTITLNLEPIQSEIYDAQRFSKNAVIVIDYDMPGMNGLELCEQMTDRNMKRILLTGKGDEKVAVEAFNAGLIDHFIQKSNQDVVKLVKENILNLEKKYFDTLSENIKIVLAQNPVSFVHDPIFQQFFSRLCQQHNIVEYYLTEITGSFLLLDADANINLLVVKGAEDLSIHYEFARDNGAPQSVLDVMRSGTKIPFSFQADDYFKMYAEDEWQKQLFPAEQLKGKEIYYYSYIENPPHITLDNQRIYSYNQYLHQLRQA